jgi:thioredoxin reductase (NADPH)
MANDYDVVILGAGAAGLSAGLYSTRAMLSTVMIESIGPGGQLLITDEIENYPGFREGVKGQALAEEMYNQADRFGAKLEFAEIEGVENLNEDRKLIRTSEGDFTARALIIATGGSHNKLGARGEDEFSGRGVSYCAVCDGNFFRGQDVVVIGGGDSAMDESFYLTGICNSVTIIHRRDELRATKVLQDRAFANPKYKWLWSHVVEEFVGNGVLEAIRVKNLKTDEIYDYPTAAAFVYVGFHPNTEYLRNILDMDELGHVYADLHMRTNIPKVYVCGDARAESTRQLGAAVGDGITAALTAFHDLST